MRRNMKELKLHFHALNLEALQVFEMFDVLEHAEVFATIKSLRFERIQTTDLKAVFESMIYYEGLETLDMC